MQSVCIGRNIGTGRQRGSGEVRGFGAIGRRYRKTRSAHECGHRDASAAQEGVGDELEGGDLISGERALVFFLTRAVQGRRAA